jgi:GH24 family phage-related lysozyme (muramidase)
MGIDCIFEQVRRGIVRNMQWNSRRSRNLDRRRLLQTSLAAAAYSLVFRSGAAWAEQLMDKFEEKLAEIRIDSALASGLRLKDDLAFTQEAGVERAPIRSPKSSTKIASKASELIIGCEVSSKTVYESAYYQPTWPRGASGVTIGMGYDVGYVSPADLAADWNGILNATEMSLLSHACGVTGDAAAALLSGMQSVSISWDDATKEYFGETQPRYVGLAEASLQNTDELTPESLGALVSLVYNRGASFSIPESKDPTNRFREMRNIKSHMANKAYDQIPAELVSMRRIWLGVKDMRGVVLRREAEAALFAYGLTLKRG